MSTDQARYAVPPAAGPVDQVAVDADGVASAVTTCPAVVSLSGGAFGQVATYLPGRRVIGVRICAESVDVHVVGVYGIPIAILAAQVRSAAASHARGRAVNVWVDDVRTPEELPRSLPGGS